VPQVCGIRGDEHGPEVLGLWMQGRNISSIFVRVLVHLEILVHLENVVTVLVLWMDVAIENLVSYLAPYF
jgi:hypothetical protein